ncbi:MAG: histidine triad nucleotide-binding protein [Christensenellales bacterium]
MDCIFCRIINQEIPSAVLYEDEDVLAFEDVDAKAPTHFLVVPKLHYPSIMQASAESMGKIIFAVQTVAKQKGIDKDGFRIVVNTGKFGGQTVDHLHFHVLGGRHLGWPPG